MKPWVKCLTRLHLSFLTCKLISATPTTLNFDEKIKWDDQVSSYGVEHIGKAHTWQQSLADREAIVSSGSTATSEALDRFMNANLRGIDLDPLEFSVQGPACLSQGCGDWTQQAEGWTGAVAPGGQSRGHWNCPAGTVHIRDFCLMHIKSNYFQYLFCEQER